MPRCGVRAVELAMRHSAGLEHDCLEFHKVTPSAGRAPYTTHVSGDRKGYGYARVNHAPRGVMDSPKRNAWPSLPTSRHCCERALESSRRGGGVNEGRNESTVSHAQMVHKRDSLVDSGYGSGKSTSSRETTSPVEREVETTQQYSIKLGQSHARDVSPATPIVTPPTTPTTNIHSPSRDAPIHLPVPTALTPPITTPVTTPPTRMVRINGRQAKVSANPVANLSTFSSRKKSQSLDQTLASTSISTSISASTSAPISTSISTSTSAPTMPLRYLHDPSNRKSFRPMSQESPEIKVSRLRAPITKTCESVTKVSDKDTKVSDKDTKVSDKDTKVSDKDTRFGDKDTTVSDNITKVKKVTDNRCYINRHITDVYDSGSTGGPDQEDNRITHAVNSEGQDNFSVSRVEDATPLEVQGRDKISVVGPPIQLPEYERVKDTLLGLALNRRLLQTYCLPATGHASRPTSAPPPSNLPSYGESVRTPRRDDKATVKRVPRFKMSPPPPVDTPADRKSNRTPSRVKANVSALMKRSLMTRKSRANQLKHEELTVDRSKVDVDVRMAPEQVCDIKPNHIKHNMDNSSTISSDCAPISRPPLPTPSSPLSPSQSTPPPSLSTRGSTTSPPSLSTRGSTTAPREYLPSPPPTSRRPTSPPPPPPISISHPIIRPTSIALTIPLSSPPSSQSSSSILPVNNDSDALLTKPKAKLLKNATNKLVENEKITPQVCGNKECGEVKEHVELTDHKNQSLPLENNEDILVSVANEVCESTDICKSADINCESKNNEKYIEIETRNAVRLVEKIVDELQNMHKMENLCKQQSIRVDENKIESERDSKLKNRCDIKMTMTSNRISREILTIKKYNKDNGNEIATVKLSENKKIMTPSQNINHRKPFRKTRPTKQILANHNTIVEGTDIYSPKSILKSPKRTSQDSLVQELCDNPNNNKNYAAEDNEVIEDGGPSSRRSSIKSSQEINDFIAEQIVHSRPTEPVTILKSPKSPTRFPFPNKADLSVITRMNTRHNSERLNGKVKSCTTSPNNSKQIVECKEQEVKEKSISLRYTKLENGSELAEVNVTNLQQRNVSTSKIRTIPITNTNNKDCEKNGPAKRSGSNDGTGDKGAGSPTQLEDGSLRATTAIPCKTIKRTGITPPRSTRTSACALNTNINTMKRTNANCTVSVPVNVTSSARTKRVVEVAVKRNPGLTGEEHVTGHGKLMSSPVLNNPSNGNPSTVDNSEHQPTVMQTSGMKSPTIRTPLSTSYRSHATARPGTGLRHPLQRRTQHQRRQPSRQRPRSQNLQLQTENVKLQIHRSVTRKHTIEKPTPTADILVNSDLNTSSTLQSSENKPSPCHAISLQNSSPKYEISSRNSTPYHIIPRENSSHITTERNPIQLPRYEKTIPSNLKAIPIIKTVNKEPSSTSQQLKSNQVFIN